MEEAVPIAMIVMGVGIAALWTRDILAGEQVDLSSGVLHARDPHSGTLFWPHWLAEYATALTLVVGAVGLLSDADWGEVVAAVGVGALLYTSVNSLGWALAERSRVAYAIPMMAGIVVGAVAAAHLLVG